MKQCRGGSPAFIKRAQIHIHRSESLCVNMFTGAWIPWVVELWVIFVLFCVFLFPKFSKTHVSL